MDYYQQQYSQEELHQLAQQRQHATNIQGGGRTVNIKAGGQVPTTQQEPMDVDGMAHMGHMNIGGMIPGGDGLEDIIMGGQRRHSVTQQHGGQQQQYQESVSMSGMYQQMDMRRQHMMEFGAGQGDLHNYQFGQPVQHTTPPLPSNSRRPSNQEMTGDYGDMATNMDLVGGSNFGTIQHSPNPVGVMHVGPPYSMPQDMPSSMMTGMMYGTNMQMGGMHDDQAPILDFNPSSFAPFSGQPISMAQDFAMPLGTAPGTLHRGNIGGRIEPIDDDGPAQDPSTSHANDSHRSSTTHPYPTPPISSGPPVVTGMGPYSSPPNHNVSGESNIVVHGPPRPPAKSAFQGVYSNSGFDMVGCLMRVAQRKNPEIDIGPVDMSCAFVVCDLQKPDCPIIYVSEIFERLTGYNKHEVLMQNCRFLQSPDGKVMAGVRRNYVDDNVVYALKRRIKKRREVQRTLINYRKGGQAFTNLLTMIPITWDDPNEIKYYVGFQVDLVDKPGAVGLKSLAGTYSVNYQQIHLPRYVWQPPDSARARQEAGHTISREDVSAVLANQPGSYDSELTRGMWDRLLLENTDDVVHVLSLKGLFLYLSPSSRHVLEFPPAELVGQALSSICHPSDIIPVTRELKDAASGQPVSIVFRVRRKVSGYTWFESHGSLCVEQGKGRKCIILVGRERPVYAISTTQLEAAGGIGDNEIWSKLSTAGMFLFVGSNVRGILDRQPDDLRGTSIQTLMRGDSKVEFGRCLERARTGKVVAFKHDVMTKRGMFMMAQTTLYPGDASEGEKPTFLVAQTRLVGKAPRNQTRNGKSNESATQLSQQSQSANTYHGQTTGRDDNTSSGTGSGTPHSNASTLLRDHVLTHAGGQALAIGSQSHLLAAANNIFAELQTTRCSSWQFELRQMEKDNRSLAEELAGLLSRRKKRKRRNGKGGAGEWRQCANCRTRSTPEWRRGPSGKRDLCNSCGLRWAKQVQKSGGSISKDGRVVTNEQSLSSGSSGGIPVAGATGDSAIVASQQGNMQAGKIDGRAPAQS